MPTEMNSYCEIIFDVVGSKFFPHEETNNEEPPNPKAKTFFDMLKAVETLLVEGDDRHSILSTCAELLYIKKKNLNLNITDDEIQEKISEGFAKYGGYDPFVFTHQVEQVSFLPYPGSNRLRTDWISVMKSRS
ncbi:hypothetical protein M9H77_21825 [Catharanthus roseus]|uniref:Uncharacterized protein n=1 Tax=Catharanthus roseus TaxID=4058 RepID=A0ACC0AND5_CATRO|nr:hypothetical protein M9H77_21825 [Catharanthus roseus]